MFFKNFLNETLYYLKLKIALETILKKEKSKIFFWDNSDFVQNLKLIISYNSKLKKKSNFLKQSKNSTKITKNKYLEVNIKFKL